MRGLVPGRAQLSLFAAVLKDGELNEVQEQLHDTMLLVEDERARRAEMELQLKRRQEEVEELQQVTSRPPRSPSDVAAEEEGG